MLGHPEVQPGSAVIDPISRTPGAEQGALVFTHVSKVFPDGTRALDDVSLQVGSGEMVAIVGPSGCGKSTLLRLASRLTTPSSGEIGVGGGNLGYVFQDATLLPWRRACSTRASMSARESFS